MSELDDAHNFMEQVASSDEFSKPLTPASTPPMEDASNKLEKNDVGNFSQYTLYSNGYAPTTNTINSLPSGCYDIEADSKTVYAVQTLKPSGLLLDLPEMRSDSVIKLVDTFLNSEKDYKEGNEFVVGGAAFKSGIMLYGPPGSGKSCTIKLVCNKLVEQGGIVFYASCHPSFLVSFLTKFAIIEQNRKSIVILEDVDSLISRYGETYYLEMLDSAKTINNVLFIATTNYPDRLDPRIYNRPGRFSHIVKIGLPTPGCREAYLKAILKNHRDVHEIVEKTNGFTIDHLTALVNAVYREKKDLSHEIERLRLLYRVPTSEDKKTLGIGRE